MGRLVKPENIRDQMSRRYSILKRLRLMRFQNCIGIKSRLEILNSVKKRRNLVCFSADVSLEASLVSDFLFDFCGEISRGNSC